MNIGLDVDGVLVDVASFQFEKGVEYFASRGKPVVDPNAYNIRGMFNCTSKEYNGFWIKNIWRYCKYEPPIENAPMIISKLHREGHRIIIITSRAFTYKKELLGVYFRAMLKKWLKKNGIVFDEIVYCSAKESHNDKLAACRRHKIDIMIDDKPENLLAVAENSAAICFPAPWNASLDSDKITKAEDWNDIYRIIRVLQNK